MTLNITSLSLGPIGTNCYIVADSDTRDAVVIDPGWDAPRVLAAAEQMDAALRAIWLTHAHFDHIGGVAGLVRALNLPVAIHSLDLPLYRNLGGARKWGIPLEPGPEPSILLDKLPLPSGDVPDGEPSDEGTLRSPSPKGSYGSAEWSGWKLTLGNLNFEVRFVPG